MRRISIFVITLLFLSSCGNNINESIHSFNTSAKIFVYDRSFSAEINEYQMSIQGESFESPIVYFENTIQYEGFSVKLSPESNSVFLLPQLILEILNSRNKSGIYNGIEYFCEFKNGTALSALTWGDVSVSFDYFK